MSAANTQPETLQPPNQLPETPRSSSGGVYNMITVLKPNNN